MKKEIIVDIRKLNSIFIILVLSISIILILFRVKLRPVTTNEVNWYMAIYGVFIIIAHEGLHGIGFRYIGNAPWENINLGFNKEVFAPYCTCSDLVLKRNQYIAIVLLPNIVLNLLTLLVIIGSNNLFWAIVGGFIFASGASDFYMAAKVLNYPKEAKFQDHPLDNGCYVFY